MNNRYNNILLITSADEDLARYVPEKPYCSLGYIAAALKRHHIRYTHIDLRFKRLRENFFKTIKEQRPDLIGTTMFSPGIDTTTTCFKR